MSNTENIVKLKSRTKEGSLALSEGRVAKLLGTAIRLCRNARGLTLLDVARRTQYSVSHLAKCERGEVQVPYDTLVAIGAGLEIPVYLITYLAEPPSKGETTLERQLAHAALVCLRELRSSEGSEEPVGKWNSSSQYVDPRTPSSKVENRRMNRPKW